MSHRAKDLRENWLMAYYLNRKLNIIILPWVCSNTQRRISDMACTLLRRCLNRDDYPVQPESLLTSSSSFKLDD